MTRELLRDYLGRETEWFLENAARADKLPEPRSTVAALLQIADLRGLHFRNTALAASEWIRSNGRRAPRARVGMWYVRWFEREAPKAPQKFKPQAPTVSAGLTSWVKGMGP